MADAQDYTANGPTDIGFRTGGDGTGITNGVVAAGTDVGVHGIGDGILGSSSTPVSIGVFGESKVGYGVKGISGTQLAGVFGQSDAYIGVEGDGPTGVRGWGRGDGDLVGVHGICGHTPQKDFTGTGVFGENDKGAGVQGASKISTGVWGHSESGWGVHGFSKVSYGGVFQSEDSYGGVLQVTLRKFASSRRLRVGPRRDII